MEKYFEYLDALRESGVANMFGAGAYLEREFNLTRKEAVLVLTCWMRTFGDGTEPVSVRVAKVGEEG